MKLASSYPPGFLLSTPQCAFFKSPPNTSPRTEEPKATCPNLSDQVRQRVTWLPPSPSHHFMGCKETTYIYIYECMYVYIYNYMYVYVYIKYSLSHESSGDDSGMDIGFYMFCHSNGRVVGIEISTCMFDLWRCFGVNEFDPDLATPELGFHPCIFMILYLTLTINTQGFNAWTHLQTTIAVF